MQDVPVKTTKTKGNFTFKINKNTSCRLRNTSLDFKSKRFPLLELFESKKTGSKNPTGQKQAKNSPSNSQTETKLHQQKPQNKPKEEEGEKKNIELTSKNQSPSSSPALSSVS